jgi:hypothetical protein
MAAKNISIADLAKVIAKQNTANYDKWQAMRDFTTQLDEQFYKSSKIEKRGDFQEMCGFERT